MMDAAAEMLSLTHASMLAGFAVFLRVSAAMAFLPVFGEQSIPNRVKLGLSLCFTIIVAPAIIPVLPAGFDQSDVISIALATEVLAGLALGFGLRLFVMALQVAGAIAAQVTSLSQIFGGGSIEAAPAMGHILLFSGLALATLLGLHVRIAEAIIYSYSVLPYGVFPHPGVISEWGIQQVSKSFAMAFSLAAPFVVASVIYNIALGVINKAMPQLMVAMVGAPAITAGGLLLLFMISPILLTIWVEAFSEYLANPFGVR
ncbi:flagellar biosynthetic protein FliR [Cochlodiniinecator piscidefendens]|uniref:flagellar biosynthetic protein FliR n=1 Tax=Cochlodiniinecator piscidefendens TaxID=2715756 RepID=UPI00140755C3|nr:flagellar biosynthetic protein FliR [Cochlodiniinecator piscidefendens]